MIGRAAGAASPSVWTWAITSWRNRRSYRAAASKSIASTAPRRAATCSSVIARPSARWASASATQSRRQVENFSRGDQSRAIRRPA